MKLLVVLCAVMLTFALVTATAAGVVYVKSDAPGPAQDGTTWATAYRSIQTAITASPTGTEIWVARGSYSVIMPKDNMRLYGGFAGTEADRAQANPRVNITVISGSDYGARLGANCTIDGFYITGNSIWGICGIYGCTISNNVIVGNQGGGIEGGGASVTIVNNVVASNRGRGMEIASPSATVSCNVVAYNGATGIVLWNCGGGASYLLTNNTIVGNQPYGIQRVGTDSLVISNNIVAFNQTGIYNDGSSPTLTRNDVYGSTSDYMGAVRGATDISTDPMLALPELGDFHIQPGSPCRNAGYGSARGQQITDIDAQSRVLDGTVDIGADESDGTAWPSTPRVVYVNASASAGGNGTSWATACKTISAAMSNILANGGAEVWVAAGTYNEQVNLLTFSFLYGGFDGTETTKASRDPGSHITTIGGKINCSGRCTVDGFTLKGGVYCTLGTPVITNNTISSGEYGISNTRADVLVQGNVISSATTGIAIEEWGSGRIVGNTITKNGQAIRIGGPNDYANSTDVLIARNKVIQNSKGVSWRSNAGRILDNQIAYNLGSGISLVGGAASVVNNTIAHNFEGINCKSTVADIHNNIVAFNYGAGVNFQSTSATLSHNDVYMNSQNYLGVGAGDHDISTDPLFALREAGDFHIQPTSPCRNAGSNVRADAATADIDGQSRIESGTVDIGADESDGTQWQSTPRIIYVNAAASVGGDGTNWARAYNKIDAAAADATAKGGGEIWVAKGKYAGSFSLPALTSLYGGFDGTETARDQRAPHANVTIIDGWNLDTVVTCQNASSINGFRIQFGKTGVKLTTGRAEVVGNVIVGASEFGIYGPAASPFIANNVLVSCPTAIYIDSGSPQICNNTIAYSATMGVRFYQGTNKVANNIITRCKKGVGINGNGTTTLLNNDLYANELDYDLLQPGATDLHVDPAFASLEMGDFHIQPDSPCRNAGTAAEPFLTLDMDGQPRQQDGTVDIGADESDGTPWDIAARVIFVDARAQIGGDGTSWAKAYKTISAALDDVQRSTGAEIWVAEGSYTETPSVGSSSYTYRLEPFSYLYGGFSGSESQREQRDYAHRQTILEGGSAYSTVRMLSMSEIDGFTIHGATQGISCISATCEIANNTISGSKGSGIDCDYSAPTITNNTITGVGIGISWDGSNPTIIGNNISKCGTGLNENSSNNALVANNRIMNSTNTGIYTSNNSGARSYYTNNTIVGNAKTGILSYGGAPVYANNLIFSNGVGIYDYFGSTQFTFSHNNVYGNAKDYRNTTPGPTDISADPMIASCRNWDVHLQPDSPCRNAGDNAAFGIPATDIDGQARVQDDAVDIGSDESNGDGWPRNPAVLYVNDSAPDGGDGMSWASAVRTISAAEDKMQYSGTTQIWVAKGIYRTGVGLLPYACIYGGFSGSETDVSQRDWSVNRTVIYGGIGTSMLSRVDGFAVYGSINCSYASPTIVNNTITGGTVGITCSTSSPFIANNMIAAVSGNGIEGLSYSAPRVVNNTIAGCDSAGIQCGYGDLFAANNIVAFCGKGMVHFESGVLTARSNNVYGNGVNYSGVTPDSSSISVDPMLALYRYGNLHLQPGSPCRNAGTTDITGLPSTDIDAQPRVMDGAIDIGADESNGDTWPTEPPVIFVDASKPGGDGSSWEKAFRSIGNAVDAAATAGGADIWVAQGLYNEQVVLHPFMAIYGGFLGGESRLSARDFTRNATKISPGSSGTGVYCAKATTVDGLQIMDGNYGLDCQRADASILNNAIDGCGQGINCYTSNAVVCGNTITRSRTNGLWITEGAPIVSRNTITGSANNGVSVSTGSPVITNNIITGSGYSGISTYAPINIANNLIARNRTGVLMASTAGTLMNNIIANNVTGIERVYSSSKLVRNALYGNTTNYKGTAGTADIYANPMFANAAVGDYHVLPGSPCIDAGDSVNAPSIDFDGNPRPRDGDGDGAAKYDIGCYEAPANYKSISAAFGLADGAPVGITCLISTAVLPDRSYVETANRIAGIGVLGTISGGSKKVTVEGIMTTRDGERLIQPSLITENGSAPVPAPFFVNCNALGGGPRGLQAGVSDWRMIEKMDDQGVPYWERDLVSFGGACNIGLLVRMAGKVTSPGSGFFYLDGYASFDDGNESIKGIRVDWPFASHQPNDGDFIEIVGVSSCHTVRDAKYGDVVVRMLRPISGDAFTVLRADAQ